MVRASPVWGLKTIPIKTAAHRPILTLILTDFDRPSSSRRSFFASGLGPSLPEAPLSLLANSVFSKRRRSSDRWQVEQRSSGPYST